MIFKTFTFSLVPEAMKMGSNAKFNFQGKKNCSGVLPPGVLEPSPHIPTSPASPSLN